MEDCFCGIKIFNQCNPMLVGTGGLTLFPGTPLLEEAQRGEFDPLSEKELQIELKTFLENLECDCYFYTHHTSGINLSGPDFLKNIKEAKNRAPSAHLKNAIRYIMNPKKTEDGLWIGGIVGTEPEQVYHAMMNNMPIHDHHGQI